MPFVTELIHCIYDDGALELLENLVMAGLFFPYYVFVQNGVTKWMIKQCLAAVSDSFSDGICLWTRKCRRKNGQATQRFGRLCCVWANIGEYIVLTQWKRSFRTESMGNSQRP